MGSPRQPASRRRSGRAQQKVSYAESDPETDREKDERPAKRNRTTPTMDEVKEFANQLSRHTMERLLIKTFKQSPDFRKVLRDLMAENYKRPSTEKVPDSHKLGTLSVLPTEILVNIMAYLGLQDRKNLTTCVCKTLNQFYWVPALWKHIDTTVIPYGVLLGNILPYLQQNVPGKCITSFTLAYKMYFLPKAEKIITILARDYELKTFRIVSGTAVITQKRLEFIRRLLQEHENFRHVRNFEMSIAHNSSFPAFNLRSLLDLFQYWPRLECIALDVPSYYMEESLNLRNFTEMSKCSIGLGNDIRLRYNYITRLIFANSMKVEAEVILHLGRLFPELEEAVFKSVSSSFSLVLLLRANRHNWYEFVSAKIPRLRSFEMVLETNSNCHDESKAASVLFFSLVHQSPNLQRLRFGQGHGMSVDHGLELFCATKEWRNWKGIRNKNLKHVRLKGWALEWDALSHNGFKFHLPNSENIDVVQCSNIRNEDYVNLMKNGGIYKEITDGDPDV